jgi:hypothetical protein
MIGNNNTQSLNVSEKSRGILAFAYNTDTTDYVSIAERTLKLASKTLGLPYTLITDNAQDYDNQRYDTDTGRFVQWRNAGRYQAYELSPYDETLVIDADFLIFNDSVSCVFDLELWDWQVIRDATGLTQQYPKYMGSNSLPYVWATAFAFKKTSRSRIYFDLIRRIQENYGFYRALYNIEQRNFRNDHAFAIADMALNGYNPLGAPALLGPMLHIDNAVTNITSQGTNFIVRDVDRAYVIPRTNMHVMSKAYLQSEQFREFIDSELA